MSEVANPGMVSVVVASYNHADYLVQRMDSLINQSYQDVEILVIDDCSPDNSQEILRRYESNPKVRLIIREQNGGWVKVSNEGVALSHGEYIIFANCDDACETQMIERLVKGLQDNPTAGISFCRSLMTNEDDQIIGDDYQVRERAFQVKCNKDALINATEMRRFLLHSCVIPNLSAALFRKDYLISVGGLNSDYRVCSDWDLFFRMAARYDVAYTAQPLNKFRQHTTTIRSSTKDRIIYEEMIRLLLKQIKVIPLTAFEHIKYRIHVMYLWASHLLRPSLSGIVNFHYHLKCVLRHDPMAVTLLPFGILFRLATLLIKLPAKLYKRINT